MHLHADRLLLCLQSLDAVHELGIWHRDVKPGNIMFADRKQQLCLIDFGLAEQTDSGEQTEPQMQQMQWCSCYPLLPPPPSSPF